MFFIIKIRDFITGKDWSNIFYKIQVITAYTPLLIFPWVFSPFSVDQLYVEKIFVLIFLSSASLILHAIRQYVINHNEYMHKLDALESKIQKTQRKKIFTRHELRTTHYEELIVNKVQVVNFPVIIKYFIIFLIILIINLLFSVNPNKSLWGYGLIFFSGIFIWMLAISQVYNKERIRAFFISGITILSIINLGVLFTRFFGKDTLSFIQASGFSASGDLYSLLFILLLAIIICIKSGYSKYKNIYVFSLFLNILSFIIFVFAHELYIVGYILFALTLAYYAYFKIKYLKKTEIILKFVIISLAILLAVFEIFLQKDILNIQREIFSPNHAWSTTLSALTDNYKNTFFGTGNNNYLFTYVSYKPQEINKTPFKEKEYFSSQYAVLEIISSFGILIFLLLAVWGVKKRKKIQKEINNNRQNIFYICILAFTFAITNLSLVSIWCCAVLLFIKYGVKTQQYYFDLQNKINFSTSKLLLVGISIITLPLLLISILFYLSSTITSIGYFSGDTNKAITGVSIFPYYNETYAVAVSTMTRIDKTKLDQYDLKAKDFGRAALELNKKDPSAFRVAIQSFSQYQAQNTLVYNLYTTLVAYAPNHLPFYFGLSDYAIKLQDYVSADEILKNLEQKTGEIDSILIRKAEIAYYLGKVEDARNFAQKAFDTTQDKNIKQSAQNILTNIKT